jgi:hypothetical protein
VGYLPGMWRDFGVTVAGLAGALTGLLFVAVSLKSETLARSRSLRSRAAQTLVLFMTAAIAAILLVAPQPRFALSAELLALAAVSGTALLVFDRRAGHDQDSGVARRPGRAHPFADGRRRPVLDDPGDPGQPGRRRHQRVAVPGQGARTGAVT